MGYESQLYVGRAVGLTDEDPTWLQVQAVFKLGKMGYDGPWAKLLKKNLPPAKPEWFIFSDDGDTEITTDPYGDNLTELPVEDLKNALRAYDDYRPARAALAWLEAYDGALLTVLHYGY